MPILRVEIFEGRSAEVKRELASALTAEMVRILGCGEASVNVVIEERKKENWAAGGQLYSDRFAD
jgi:4-oxalocrotonate tautomerase